MNFLTYLVKWKLGFRSHSVHQNVGNRLEAQFYLDGSPINIGEHGIAERTDFDRIRDKLGNARFKRLFGEIEIPDVDVDDRYVSIGDALAFPFEGTDHPDILSDSTIINIKASTVDTPLEWLKQAALHAAMANQDYDCNIKTAIVINYITGKSYKLDLRLSPADWHEKFLVRANEGVARIQRNAVLAQNSLELARKDTCDYDDLEDMHVRPVATCNIRNESCIFRGSRARLCIDGMGKIIPSKSYITVGEVLIEFLRYMFASLETFFSMILNLFGDPVPRAPNQD